MKTDFVVANGRVMHVPAPFGVMGIVNVTPDSFYAASRVEPKAVVQRLRTMWDEGADIIDVGAESSRPGAMPVTAETELARLLPVVCAANTLAITLSIDTYRASTAACVLNLGCSIINDISAARFDPELCDVLGQYKPGYVLMHAGEQFARRHDQIYTNITDTVLAFFEERLKVLTCAGLPENRIVLDPGIGFGKTTQQNLELMRNVQSLRTLGRPLLYGLSMKRMFTDLLGVDVADRKLPTQIATAFLYQQGVFWHRVHAVAETRRTLTLAQAMQGVS